MNKDKNSRKAIGLCSGGLDSILSAMLLKKQGIDVTWLCFETPFFSSLPAKKASEQTGIPLKTIDITESYMVMMKNPKAGFGKNMNPCMDCHSLMFAAAGEFIGKENFSFIFSGEVLGQRPKSQTRNALRYVEKNSGFSGFILRPLSAKLLDKTIVEKQGVVDREKLMGISGRSRKIQMQMAEEFGIKEYPSPAGGCLLTDRIFSAKLKELMDVQNNFEKKELYLLKNGRHFRLDNETKVIVGRSKNDNRQLLKHYDRDKDILIRNASLPGPDVIVTGRFSDQKARKAALLCAGYTKAQTGETLDIKIFHPDHEALVSVKKVPPSEFKDLMI